MTSSAIKPEPLFDTHAKFLASTAAEYTADRPAICDYLDRFPAAVSAHSDFKHVRAFLKSFSNQETTFKGYRSQVERLMLWSWIKAGKSVIELTRTDAESFMEFNMNPDPEWVGTAVRYRFLEVGEIHEPNPLWRPFSTRDKKVEKKRAAENAMAIPDHGYQVAQGSLRQVFAICSSFYDFLTHDDISTGNPFRAIKQKSRWTQRNTTNQQSHALSEMQWEFVIETAELMADEDPVKHERTLFIVATLFAMYLRVSDIVGNPRWVPTMASFNKRKGTWWYSVNGKGNKNADITVKPDYLRYLKRYRASRNLPPLPYSGETSPLLVKLNGDAGLTDRQVRNIVQAVFDKALSRMQEEGFKDEDVDELRSVTLHWLRHTSATFDAKTRDMKHLQTDLRHTNMSTTQDVYYNSLDEERSESAAKIKISQR